METENGIEIRRHADQKRPRSLETPKQPTPISEKERTYLMTILIFQYELLYELILLINRLHLIDLHHLLLLFPSNREIKDSPYVEGGGE